MKSPTAPIAPKSKRIHFAAFWRLGLALLALPECAAGNDGPDKADPVAREGSGTWGALRAGMSESELVSLLGEPERRLGPGDFRILEYPDGEIFLKDNRVVDWKGKATALLDAPLPPKPPTAGAAPDAPASVAAQATEKTRVQKLTRKAIGLPASPFTDYVRSYEANEGGQTWDRHNDPFLDFTFSVMLPLPQPPLYSSPDEVDPHHQIEHYYPTVLRFPAASGNDNPGMDYRGWPRPYFAVNVREGFYWFGSRYSGPVVSKRMNPLLALRWWAKYADHSFVSEDNFIELAYGHESNGQVIDTKAAFDAQVATYLEQPASNSHVDPATAAYRDARDNISRGWDYLGVQYSRDWLLADSPKKYWAFNLRAKANYYLPHGILQGRAEEYRSWEEDPEGKPRRDVDGLSFRLTGRHHDLSDNPNPGYSWSNFFGDRFAFSFNTGYARPGRYNTFKLETGLPYFGTRGWLKDLPTMVWYRYGYDTNLVDYYRKNESFGIKISMWKFTTGD